MFRSAVVTLLMGTTLFGGVLDFRTLEKAKEAYAGENYSESAALYDSFDNKNDDLHFNLGDAYYKDKKYDEALKQYEQVQKPELKAKTLHNMGNTYAKMGKTDEAISSYEEALKLGEDEDTRFNLELLKKQKKEQDKKDQDQENKDKKNDDQKKQDDQKNQNSKDDQKKDDGSKQDQKENQSDSKEQQKQNEKEQQQKEQEEKEKEQQSKEDEASKKEKSEKEQGEMKPGDVKEEPISDMQERKYEKMLDKRGIKTLMVPLKTEGAPHEEKTAW